MSLPAAPPLLFDRYGISEQLWQECRAIVSNRHSEHVVDDSIGQGGCSYTVKLKRRTSREEGEADDVLIIQLRPLRFALPTDIVVAAKEWYGHLAPSVSETCRRSRHQEGQNTDGLVVYKMSFLPGRRLDELLPSPIHINEGTTAKYPSLLDDVAAFYGQAWHRGMQLRHVDREPRCTGKIGSTILHRLDKLARFLPSHALRSIAGRAGEEVACGALDELPIVLTHGDLLPSNILVDPETWHLTGLVDWAESEYLPFGMSFYGLEHLLGYTSSSISGAATEHDLPYQPEASSLREYFWQRLFSKVPELNESRTREAVEVARTVGILLWHGFAWDDGKIDRVVEAGRDGREVAFLEAFLDVRDGCPSARL